MSENSGGNIYQKMSDISIDIGVIAKNLIVGTGKQQYKATAEKDILKAVKEQEAAKRVFSYPRERHIVFSETLNKTTDYGEKSSLFIRIETIYRFINIDKPDEYVEVTGYGDGIDSLDKAPGKAISYSDKYCLMKAYKIETDDLDEKASDDLAGHDVFKIKTRIEQLLTAKIQTGMTIETIARSLNVKVNDIQKILKYPEQLNLLEKKLLKL